MLGKPGPFQVIEEEGFGIVEDPVAPPRRRFSCRNYELCLNLAAALNWDNFTCRGCSSEVNSTLLWRARQAMKRDTFINKLCELPQIPMICQDEEDEELKVAVK